MKYRDSKQQVVNERAEDCKALRDLYNAIRQNGGRALIPWAKVKKELDID